MTMKERDIRKREAHNKYLELVRLDSERIFRDKSAFITISCPACESKNYEPQFEKEGFTVVQCAACDTLFVNPRPCFSHLMQMYTNSHSAKFWVNEFFLPVAEMRRETIFTPRAQTVASRFLHFKNGSIADIGAGFGLFLEELKKIWHGANLMAIEPSEDMASICRNKGFSVIESMLEEIDPARHAFDLLTAFELFEHLHEPGVFLRKAHRLLHNGGYVLLTTLNAQGFDIQLLWEKSKSVSPPIHLNFFNTKSLQLLLERCGFQSVDVTTPGRLDWDIVEGMIAREGVDAGRFWNGLAKTGSEKSKKELQNWISENRFSSHMMAVAKK